MGLVLVHSPFLTASTWLGAAAELRRLGRTSTVVDLHSGESTHAGQVATVVEAIADQAGEQVTCIVHSGAGPLAPVIEEGADRSLRWVFVDATAPHPRRSRHEMMPDGIRAELRSDGDHYPPWNRWFSPGTVEGLLPEATVRRGFIDALRPIPAALLDDPMPPSADWPAGPGVFVQLSDAYAAAAKTAAGRGWPAVRRRGHHLWMVTHPDQVAGAIAEALELL